jgi:hypothetical protein
MQLCETLKHRKTAGRSKGRSSYNFAGRAAYINDLPQGVQRNLGQRFTSGIQQKDLTVPIAAHDFLQPIWGVFLAWLSSRLATWTSLNCLGHKLKLNTCVMGLNENSIGGHGSRIGSSQGIEAVLKEVRLFREVG